MEWEGLTDKQRRKKLCIHRLKFETLKRNTSYYKYTVGNASLGKHNFQVMYTLQCLLLHSQLFFDHSYLFQLSSIFALLFLSFSPAKR